MWLVSIHDRHIGIYSEHACAEDGLEIDACRLAKTLPSSCPYSVPNNCANHVI